MVNRLICRWGLAGCLAWAGFTGARASDFAAWPVGGTASEDVATPVALDVVDAGITAERRAEQERKIPAIFLRHSSVTNTMVVKVTEAFDNAHSKFVAGLQKTFHQSRLDETTIQSAAFGHFVDAFNAENDRFLITTEIARNWARGNPATDTRARLIDLLLKTTSRPVRADDTPDGFQLGDTVRLVPVHSSSDVVTVKDAEQGGEVCPLDRVTTVTRLRGLFRRNFSAPEQPFARQLATYIHPDCLLDVALTGKARQQGTAKIVFLNHYAAGQMIVRRGQVIDERIHAALVKLDQTTVPAPAAPATTAAVQNKVQPVTTPVRLESNPQNVWFIAALAGGSVALLLGLGILVLRRRGPGSNKVATIPVQNTVTLPAEIAPQIAQALKSAVVQELAAQRQELLKTQQTAAIEVLQLMQRLNELQAPWQERLAAYEKRIHELERELTLRTEENRELLKLKIELLRRQLEAERGNPRVNFN